MKFGSVPVANAVGCTLAHGVVVDSGRFAKGRVLNADDIQALAHAGLTSIFVARLSTKDVPENEASAEIGSVLKSKTISAKSASTGRVNLHAETSGLLKIKAKSINKINGVEPSITVTTLPDFTVCQAGAMVATVKIIPFAAPRKSVREVTNLAGKKVLELLPFQPLQVGLIQTTLPHTKDSVLEKTADVTRQRVTGFSGAITVSAHCEHNTHDLAETLHAMLGLDMLIVFGASAVCDEEDVIPAAIRLVGGKITRVGMPVDPGNLLVLGHKGKTTIIGAPGCARSPKENGFDWVLARLFAGLKVKPRDIISMGVAGLLMEIPTRPSPRSITVEAERSDD
jgi:molybdenum cofactor cytidylyltransferase